MIIIVKNAHHSPAVYVLIILLLIGINVTLVGMDIIPPEMYVDNVLSDALNAAQLKHVKNALNPMN